MLKKRAIVTGGTGFIGINLVRRLLDEEHEVHLLVRSNYKNWRIIDLLDRIKIHRIDFSSSRDLSSLMTRIKPNWIFHLATYGASLSQQDFNQTLRTNLIGTMNLMQACLKTDFEAFVNTGSSSEYGFKNNAPSEKEFLEPNSYYALTKVFSTLLCQYLARQYRRHMVTLRLYSTYGPYEEPIRLIPTLILFGMQGKLPPLTDSNVAHDFVFVKDVIDAYLLTATKTNEEPGTIYNIGTGVQTSLYEVFQIVRRILNIKVKPVWAAMSNRPWDTSTWISNNHKAWLGLRWRYQYSFEAGLKETIQWFCKNPHYIEFYSLFYPGLSEVIKKAP